MAVAEKARTNVLRRSPYILNDIGARKAAIELCRMGQITAALDLKELISQGVRSSHCEKYISYI